MFMYYFQISETLHIFMHFIFQTVYSTQAFFLRVSFIHIVYISLYNIFIFFISIQVHSQIQGIANCYIVTKRIGC